MSQQQLPSSFRDPCGYVFLQDGAFHRAVLPPGLEDFETLMSSGLYKALVARKLLVAHEELGDDALPEGACKVLRPTRIPFISYPYEWCFSQWREAALATLDIQRIAMEHGMTLKDASAFNLQWLEGRATFIDTLSFTRWEENRPWVAYRQFCTHFLGPLALMSLRHPDLAALFQARIDGFPLDLVSRLLPWRTRWTVSMGLHLHAQAYAERTFASDAGRERVRKREPRMSRQALFGLVDSLRGAVSRLRPPGGKTTWGNYYGETNYSSTAFQAKKDLVARMLDQVRPSTVWDLGANAGEFSRLAAEHGAFTVAFDMDVQAIEHNHRLCRERRLTTLLPLVMDLSRPSPAVGWNLSERLSLKERGPADLLLALALIHHLVMGNHLSFRQVADAFAELGPWLIIEFVPRDDSQVQRLLANRPNAFPDYDEDTFLAAFAHRYDLVAREKVSESSREIFLMRLR